MSAVTGPSHQEVVNLVNILERSPPSESRRVRLTAFKSHKSPKLRTFSIEQAPILESRTFVGIISECTLVPPSDKKKEGCCELQFQGIQTDPYQEGLSDEPKNLIFVSKEYKSSTSYIHTPQLSLEMVPHDGWIADVQKVVPITKQVHEALPYLPSVLRTIVTDYLEDPEVQPSVEEVGSQTAERPEDRPQGCFQSAIRCAKLVCGSLAMIKFV